MGKFYVFNFFKLPGMYGKKVKKSGTIIDIFIGDKDRFLVLFNVKSKSRFCFSDYTF